MKEKGEWKEKKERKETQEIVIRKKGEKDLKLNVEITGDSVTINGKPLSEFKDDEVVINRRKMTLRNGNDVFAYNMGPDNMLFDREFMQEWKAEGKGGVRPFLGVTTEPTEKGAKITEVVKESAAEKAGLKVNDVITRVGDKKLTDEENLSAVIAAKKPKESVTIAYVRNGKEGTVKAVLGERKTGPMTFAFSAPRGKVRSFSYPTVPPTPNLELLQGEGLADLEGFAPGQNYGPFSFARQKKIGLKISDTDEGGNVKVIEVEEGSAAEKAGIKKDDIITEIAGKKINNTDDAREQLNPVEAKPSYPVKALRGGKEMSFEIKIPKKLKTANL
jgi:serine protease Do